MFALPGQRKTSQSEDSSAKSSSMRPSVPIRARRYTGTCEHCEKSRDRTSQAYALTYFHMEVHDCVCMSLQSLCKSAIAISLPLPRNFAQICEGSFDANVSRTLSAACRKLSDELEPSRSHAALPRTDVYAKKRGELGYMQIAAPADKPPMMKRVLNETCHETVSSTTSVRTRYRLPTSSSEDECDGSNNNESEHDQCDPVDAHNDCSDNNHNTGDGCDDTDGNVSEGCNAIGDDESEHDLDEACHDTVMSATSVRKRHRLPTSSRSAKVVRGKRRQPCTNGHESASGNHRHARTNTKRKKTTTATLGPPVTPCRRSRRTVKQEVGEPLRRYHHSDGKWEITHSVERVHVGLNCLFWGNCKSVR